MPFLCFQEQFFKGIGVWEEIFPNIGKFQNISLSDADYPHIVHFDKETLNTDYLGYVAEHRYILKPLQKFSQNSSNIQWLSSTKLIDIEEEKDNITITVETKEGKKNNLKLNY